MTPLLCLLVFLTPCLEYLAVGEEGLIHELGLVLLPNPVPSLMVLNCMLEDHDHEHLNGWCMCKFRFCDEVTYVLRLCMDPFIRLLLQI